MESNLLRISWRLAKVLGELVQVILATQYDFGLQRQLETIASRVRRRQNCRVWCFTKTARLAARSFQRGQQRRVSCLRANQITFFAAALSTPTPARRLHCGPNGSRSSAVPQACASAACPTSVAGTAPTRVRCDCRPAGGRPARADAPFLNSKLAGRSVARGRESRGKRAAKKRPARRTVLSPWQSPSSLSNEAR